MCEARVLRSTAASAVVTLCGVGAHLSAGGTVAAWVVPLLLVMVLPVALIVTERRVGTSQMLGLLVLGQVAVHGLAGHVEGGLLMLAAHVLATAVSLVVLRHGEDAWWRVADALGLLARRGLPRSRALVPRPCATPAVNEPWFPRLKVLVTGVGGRAPPAGV